MCIDIIMCMLCVNIHNCIIIGQAAQRTCCILCAYNYAYWKSAVMQYILHVDYSHAVQAAANERD